MDLINYVITNWANQRNLGEVLRQRMFIYVGSHDTYFLNEGVAQFQQRVTEIGGPDWANVTVLAGRPHGGTYNNLPLWDYLELLYSWIQDHSPNGKTPLSANVTATASRGNEWDEVIARGGRQAAIARQAPPSVHSTGRRTFGASVGEWDPGMVLEAQWTVDGKPYGKSFGAKQGQAVDFVSHLRGRKRHLQLSVIGSKIGHVTETRNSNIVVTGQW